MPFSRACAPIASRISRLMRLLLDQVGTVYVGVGDLHDPAVGGQDDLALARADELAGEAAVPVVRLARAHLRAAADVAAEVIGLGERPLATGRGDLQAMALADGLELVGHALAEL